MVHQTHQLVWWKAKYDLLQLLSPPSSKADTETCLVMEVLTFYGSQQAGGDQVKYSTAKQPVILN